MTLKKKFKTKLIRLAVKLDLESLYLIIRKKGLVDWRLSGYIDNAVNAILFKQKNLMEENINRFIDLHQKKEGRALNIVRAHFELFYKLLNSDEDFYYENIETMTKDAEFVLIEGLNRSGSGAVHEYLSECEDVISIGIESRKFIRESFGIIDLSKKNGRDFIAGLLFFYIKHILGYSRIKSFINFSDIKTPDKYKYFVQTTKFTNTLNGEMRLIEFTKILRRFKQVDSSQYKLKTQKKGLVQDLSQFMVQSEVGLHDAGGKILTRNIFSISEELKYADQIFRKFHVIVVLRSPGDHYADLMNNERSVSSIDEFIKKIERQYFNVLDAQKSLGRNISLIFFEDFVRNEFLREMLINKIDSKQLTTKRKYEPQSSEKNIGIHKNLINNSERNKLESVIAKYGFKSDI